MTNYQKNLDIKIISTDFYDSSFNKYYSLTNEFGRYNPIKDNDPVFKVLKKNKKDKTEKKLKKTITQELEDISMEKNRKMSVPRSKGILSNFVNKIDNVENLLDSKVYKDLKSDCICILEKMLKTYERKLGPEDKLTLEVKQKLKSEKESLC